LWSDMCELLLLLLLLFTVMLSFFWTKLIDKRARNWKCGMLALPVRGND
jgi:type II secretory pathway component PulF